MGQLLDDVDVDFFVLRRAFCDYLRGAGLGGGHQLPHGFLAREVMRPLARPGLSSGARQALGLAPMGPAPSALAWHPSASPLPPATAAAWSAAFWGAAGGAALQPTSQVEEARRRAEQGEHGAAFVRLQTWLLAADHAPCDIDPPARARHAEACRAHRAALLELACTMPEVCDLAPEGASLQAAATALADAGELLPPQALALAGLAGRLAAAGPGCRRLSTTALALWNTALAAMPRADLHAAQAEALRLAAGELAGAWARFGPSLPAELLPRPLAVPPSSAETWTVWLPDDVGWCDVPELSSLVDVPETVRDFCAASSVTLPRYERIDLGRNLLLHGPAGSGKTALLEAMCRAIGATTIRVSAGKLLSPTFSVSQQNIQALFEYATARARHDGRRVVLLIDGAELLLHARDLPNLGPEDLRNVNTFLRGLTGLRPGMGGDFRVLAATRNVTDIDAAMRSRFHDVVGLQLPDIPRYERLLARAYGESYPAGTLAGQQAAWAACGLDLYALPALTGEPGTPFDLAGLTARSIDLHLHATQRAGTVRSLSTHRPGTGFIARLTWPDVPRRLAAHGQAHGVLAALFDACGRTWKVSLNHDRGCINSAPLSGIRLGLLRGPAVKLGDLKMYFIDASGQAGPVDLLSESAHGFIVSSFVSQLDAQWFDRPASARDASCFGIDYSNQGLQTDWRVDDMGIDIDALLAGRSPYLRRGGSVELHVELTWQEA